MRHAAGRVVRRGEAKTLIAELTPRQHQILISILAGYANKSIAADLHISQRAIESHRAAIMKMTGCRLPKGGDGIRIPNGTDYRRSSTQIINE